MPIPVRSVGLDTNIILWVSMMPGVELFGDGVNDAGEPLVCTGELNASITSAARSLVERTIVYSPCNGFARA